jgi:hypothetical protein
MSRILFVFAAEMLQTEFVPFDGTGTEVETVFDRAITIKVNQRLLPDTELLEYQSISIGSPGRRGPRQLPRNLRHRVFPRLSIPAGDGRDC